MLLTCRFSYKISHSWQKPTKSMPSSSNGIDKYYKKSLIVRETWRTGLIDMKCHKQGVLSQKQDEKSSLVQIMAWCRQATSQFLNQCWPSSMLPYGVTRPQSFNKSMEPRVKENESNWRQTFTSVSVTLKWLGTSIISTIALSTHYVSFSMKLNHCIIAFSSFNFTLRWHRLREYFPVENKGPFSLYGQYHNFRPWDRINIDMPPYQ